jgi:hypothetical protein
MNTNLEIPMVCKLIAGLACAVIWGIFAFNHVQDPTGIVEFCKYILAGLTGHLLTASGQSKQVPPFPVNKEQ